MTNNAELVRRLSAAFRGMRVNGGAAEVGMATVVGDQKAGGIWEGFLAEEENYEDVTEDPPPIPMGRVSCRLREPSVDGTNNASASSERPSMMTMFDDGISPQPPPPSLLRTRRPPASSDSLPRESEINQSMTNSRQDVFEA